MDFFSSVLAKSMCGGGGGAGNDVRALMITKEVGGGDRVEITDAAPVGLLKAGVSMPGFESTQITVYGSNLLVPSDSTVRTQNGVTYYFDAETGEFVLNGTVNAAGDIKLVPVLQLDWEPGETYTFYASCAGGSATIAPNTGGYNTTYGFGIFQSDAAKYIRGSLGKETIDTYEFTGTAFELAEKKNYILYLQCWRIGTVFDNFRIRILLEKGGLIQHGWKYPTRQVATMADAGSITMNKGYNLIIGKDVPDMIVEYAVDPKTYIDNKIAGVE